jgi:hypothetical protein
VTARNRAVSLGVALAAGVLVGLLWAYFDFRHDFAVAADRIMVM